MPVIPTAVRAFVALSLTLLGALPAAGQQGVKVHRIGLLSMRAGPSNREEAFRQELRDLGYVEGRNITIEYRWAAGRVDRLPGMAAELVRLKVDLIVAGGTPPTEAARNATQTIPIVMAVAADPVGVGLVASLARPGGNVTGPTLMSPELTGKRLELLKEVVPRVSRVAVLAYQPSSPTALQLREAEAAAGRLGIGTHPVMWKGPDEFGAAFSRMKQDRANGLLVLLSQVSFEHRRPIVDLAARNRLPAIYEVRDFADAGGLMAYGPNSVHLHRRAATYVDKILKGAKPADLPVEQPTRFELVINLKSAKALGLTIPPSVLVRADQVIQ